MRTADLVRFSARALRGHRLRTVLSLLGVAIGVASVIILTSLGEGARLYVTGEFASLGSNLLIVMPGKTETTGGAPFVSTAPNDLTLNDVEATVQRVPLIRRVAAMVLGSGEASFGTRGRQTTVIGTTSEMLAVRHLRMQTGRFFAPDEEDAPLIVLGARVRQELFGNANPLGQMVRIGDWRFRVVGVLAARGTSIGMNIDDVVMIPVETGMRLFNLTSLFRVLVEVRAHSDMEAAKQAITAVLKQRHGGDEDFTAITQEALLATFGRILAVLTAALAGIAAISLSVAGIGIMNVMLVSVTERTREIGLLKALGVTPLQIVQAFLLEAAILSTAGGLIGLATGIGAGQIFRRFVPEFPVQPPVWAVVAAVAVSISVGLVFGIIPARRAARLDPVAALTSQRA